MPHFFVVVNKRHLKLLYLEEACYHYINKIIIYATLYYSLIAHEMNPLPTSIIEANKKLQTSMQFASTNLALVVRHGGGAWSQGVGGGRSHGILVRGVMEFWWP